MPGKFNPDVTPYCLEIYSAIAQRKHKIVVPVMGTQMGKTEMCFNVVAHKLDTFPVPTSFAFPTEYLAQSVSKGRFDKLLRTCESLRKKVTMDQVLEKHIGGSVLRFVWTTSATQLCSHPTCLVIIDERDRMGNDVEGEGDPVELLDARTVTYGALASILVTSTPTLWGASPTWSLMESGTMKKWCFNCAFCGQDFPPSLEVFGWAEDLSDAWITCPHCNKNNTESQHRQQLFSSGHYKMFGQESAVIESFWVSGLSSPWRTWKEAAEKWSKAHASGDHNKMQAVVNTVFGEPYKLQGEILDWQTLRGTGNTHKVGDIPPGVQVKTLGCDVQADCIYYALRGWEKEKAEGILRSYVITYGILLGNTEEDAVWQKLDNLIRATAPRIACIDSGYRSHLVYAFCREKSGHCIPCKGSDRQGAPIRTSPIDTIYKAGKLQASSLRLYRVDDYYYKSLFFSGLKMANIILPSNVEDEYLKQITAEQLVTSRTGEQVYEKRYTQNHWLDCEKLNMVSATVLRLDLMGQEAPVRDRIRSRGIE